MLLLVNSKSNKNDRYNGPVLVAFICILCALGADICGLFALIILRDICDLMTRAVWDSCGDGR